MMSDVIKLDNFSLLFWTKYRISIINEETVPTIKLYDHLGNSYELVKDNLALLERLRDLLVLDTKTAAAAAATIPVGARRRFFGQAKRKSEYEALKIERKKAYDAYEMLRRLSFAPDEGNEFIIELTN